MWHTDWKRHLVKERDSMLNSLPAGEWVGKVKTRCIYYSGRSDVYKEQRTKSDRYFVTEL